MSDSETIVALSSPAGGADRAVVRLSGPKALSIAARLVGCRLARRRACVDAPSMSAWVMPAPDSYTREDVVELHIAGAVPVARDTVERCIAAGARAAEPGEFTRRAFLNGRLDLAQAESVQSVIAARSADEVRAALGILRGAWSRELHVIEEELLTLCADVEAAIDFVDQDIEIVSPAEALARSRRIAASLGALLAGTASRRVADGRPTVFLHGAPNAGKSSLFNRLTEGRSIVSSVAGTTRDVLAGECDGVRLLDAPGIQDAMGVDADAVQRARHEAQHADAWIVVVDASAPVLPEASARVVLRVANKSDLGVSKELRKGEWLLTSALTGEGVEVLRARLREFALGSGSEASGARFIVSARQRERLGVADSALRQASEGLVAGVGMEFVALDLRAALDAMGAVTGRSVSDDLLGRIFERFCVGK